MAGRDIALLGARLVDPARGTESGGGVLVRDGMIAAIGPEITAECRKLR